MSESQFFGDPQFFGAFRRFRSEEVQIPEVAQPESEARHE